jgi:hypothetical protein
MEKCGSRATGVHGCCTYHGKGFTKIAESAFYQPNRMVFSWYYVSLLRSCSKPVSTSPAGIRITCLGLNKTYATC